MIQQDQARFRQLHVLKADASLISAKREDHWFDRKSIKIDAPALANVLVGFANADGGTVLVGVEKDGTVTGVDAHAGRVNELRQAALDFTTPTVRHETSFIPCVNHLGNDDHLLVFEVPPSDRLHENHKGEVFLRVGDETRRLRHDQVQDLRFDKGDRPFDSTPAIDASLDDLDEVALNRFAELIGLPNDIERALRVRGFLLNREGRTLVTHGAILMFGKAPTAFLPGAFTRILRYDGTEALAGTRSNLTFDRRIAGALPDQIAQAEDVMNTLLRQVTTLDPSTGRFVTLPELPRFVWLEAIVNAIAHRSYSVQGDHIRVRLFDDRLEVESPGRLPGPVRVDNIRDVRHARNPRIARALADLRLVLELNEGMNRMFAEMASAGLPEPRLHQTEGTFRVTLYNSSEAERAAVAAAVASVPAAFAPVLDVLLTEGRITTRGAADLAGVSAPTARRYLQSLADSEVVELVARSARDPQSYWRWKHPLRGRWRLANRAGERT